MIRAIPILLFRFVLYNNISHTCIGIVSNQLYKWDLREHLNSAPRGVVCQILETVNLGQCYMYLCLLFKNYNEFIPNPFLMHKTGKVELFENFNVLVITLISTIHVYSPSGPSKQKFRSI